VISRIATFAHSGNPTIAPTAALPATQKDDILVLAVANGGSNSNPAISGTSVALGGLTWTRKVSGVGPIQANAFNGSFWWARAKENHVGQTVIATTVDSGSLVGAVYRGAASSGDPLRFGLAENNELSGNTGITAETPLLAGDFLIFGVAVDDNSTAPTDRIFLKLGGEVVSGEKVAVYSMSEGGADTGAALWDYRALSTDTLEAAEAEILEPESRSICVVAALIPLPEEEGGAPSPMPGRIGVRCRMRNP